MSQSTGCCSAVVPNCSNVLLFFFFFGSILFYCICLHCLKVHFQMPNVQDLTVLANDIDHVTISEMFIIINLFATLLHVFH